MVFDSLNIDQSLMDQFYYHSSRKLLWPIFHGLWQYAKECSTAWAGFVKVNNLVAEHLANRLSKNANVVIHDYNFLLVPNKLKQLRPDVCISYFHHIPWNSQAFQLFRYRLQILNSLKNCDHVYMHIPYYINELYRSFNENMVASVIDYQSSMPKFNVSRTSVCCENYSSRIQLGERSVSCYAEPMPINTNVMDEYKELVKKEYTNKDKTTYLVISRIDYTKGITELLDHLYHTLITQCYVPHRKIGIGS